MTYSGWFTHIDSHLWYTDMTYHSIKPTVPMHRLDTKFKYNSNLNGSRSSLLPIMDRPPAPMSLDPARDSTKPLDELDLTSVGICRPAGGKPMPRRPASRHLTVAGNGRLVRASFRNCETHTPHSLKLHSSGKDLYSVKQSIPSTP